MQNLKVSLVQSDLIWENSQKNLSNFEEVFRKQIPENTNLVVLPEMFTTGFSMEPFPLAEMMDGNTLHWMEFWSKKLDAAIVGSYIVKENFKFYNRLVWMKPDGSYHHYNKRHLFTMAGEHKQYSPGQEKVIIEYKGWKFCPLICYDLRFPVWIRNKESYDCIVLVANWPAKRADQWETMVKARSIENQCYTLAVNRVGKDANDILYNGNSLAVTPLGRVLGKCTEIEAVINIELDKERLENARNQMPFLNDMDDFEIKV